MALNPRQQKALNFYLEGNSIDEIAQKCEAHKRTVFRWLKLPEFEEAAQQMHGKIADEVGERIARIRIKSLKAIEEILDDPEMATRHKLQAVGYGVKVSGLDTPADRAANELLKIIEELKDELSAESYTELIKAIVGSQN